MMTATTASSATAAGTAIFQGFFLSATGTSATFTPADDGNVVICVVFMGSELLSATTPGTSQNVRLVGQNTLFGRGMNADHHELPLQLSPPRLPTDERY